MKAEAWILDANDAADVNACIAWLNKDRSGVTSHFHEPGVVVTIAIRNIFLRGSDDLQEQITVETAGHGDTIVKGPHAFEFHVWKAGS